MVFLRRTGLFLLSLWLLASSISPAPSGAVLIEKVRAVVNGEIITQTELQERSLALIRRMSSEAAERSGRPSVEETEKQILEGLIDQKLQLQESHRLGITVSSEEVNAYIEDLKKSNNIGSDEDFKRALATEGLTLERFKQDVENHLRTLQVVGKEVRSTIIVSEPEMRKAYEDEIDKFVEPLQVRLRYLLIPAPEGASREEIDAAKKKAETALLRLNRGEDFSQVVKEFSSGPMAETGGDIGYVKKGELHPEVEKAALSLKEGEHSEIISIPSGWVIIKVEERRSPIRPYAEVANQLRNQIYEKKVEKKYREWIQALRDKALIEIK
jgi:peptidyl-prolyl cis-trans isomerase SurA